MIYLKKFNESKESIESICLKYGITNYTINEDGTIDVNGHVNLSDRGLTRLPLRFRNIIGSFFCHNNRLITLEGAPRTVGGHFYFNNNQLTTLQGAPTTVGSYFYCSYNQLITLEGAPTTIGGSFNCQNNQLTTLEGAPRKVHGSFVCENNKLTTLEGAPRTIGRDFFCNNNKLVNLEFAPSCKWLYCDSNPIDKWWSKVKNTSKLDAFIDLGIDARDPDFMNLEKINLLNE